MFSGSIYAHGEDPSAYNIAVGDDWQNTDKTAFGTINAYVNNQEKWCIGTTTIQAFLFKNISNAYYDYYLVAYKIAVKPKMSTKKHGLFYNYYGWSESLYASCQLSSDETLTNYSPVTVNPTTSYTVGLNAGAEVGDSGLKLSAGISCSITVTGSSLRIKNNSDSSSGLFSINYDYMCDIAHSKSYLTTETQQYGMFVVQSPKGREFNHPMRFEMYFMVSDGWSFFLLTYPNFKASSFAYVSFE